MVYIPINLVVEDYLSEAVLRKIIRQSHCRFSIGYCYCKGGYGYIKRKIRGFNNAAKGTPFLVLADLEAECAPIQIRGWLPEPAHQNLLFRIAIREIESWLLADRMGFASFLSINRDLIPNNVDEIADPKQWLINLARRSRKRVLREAIVPAARTTAKVGPDYNGPLAYFVENHWNAIAAMDNSPSLERAVNAIARFEPTWCSQ